MVVVYVVGGNEKYVCECLCVFIFERECVCERMCALKR